MFIIPTKIGYVCSIPIGSVAFPSVVVDIAAAIIEVQEIVVCFPCVLVTPYWGTLRFLLLMLSPYG